MPRSYLESGLICGIATIKNVKTDSQKGPRSLGAGWATVYFKKVLILILMLKANTTFFIKCTFLCRKTNRMVKIIGELNLRIGRNHQRVFGDFTIFKFPNCP